MSASEKLKGLLAETTQEWPEGQAGTSCIDCFTPVPSVAVQVMPALPQIAAVVEAAEATSACLPGLHDNSLRHSLEIQRGALAALDEALGEGK